MKRFSSQKGIFVVLVALLLVAIIGLCAIVLGLGQLSISKSRLKNVSNIAALSALEAYTRSDGANFGEKSQAAAQKLDLILAGNTISGLKGLLASPGVHTDGESGKIEFGVWVTHSGFTIPDNGGTVLTCADGIYPCFQTVSSTNAGSSPTVTAVRLNLWPQSNNLLTLPFVKVLTGMDTVRPTATSMAAVTQRCSAFLIDVSPSITQETHKPLRYWTQPNGAACRVVAGSRQDCFSAPDQPLYDGIPGGTQTVPGHCLIDEYLYAFPYNNGITATECPAKPAYEKPWHAYFQARVPPSDPYIEGAAAAGKPEWEDPASLPVWDPVGLFAFRESAVEGRSPLVASTYDNGEYIYWANMPLRRPLDGSYDSIPTVHFKSDYGVFDDADDGTGGGDGDMDETETACCGKMYIDRLYIPGVYDGPQPFTRMMDGFNAGFRYLRDITSNVDLNLLSGFSGDPIGRPRGRVPNAGMLSDLDYFIQITNPRNRGLVGPDGTDHPDYPDEVKPNFINEDIFPILGTDFDATTNIVSALNLTIATMSQFCPATSKKQIIIATDGIMTCSQGNAGLNCTGTYANFNAAVSQLLGPASPNILQQLVELEIALTVVLDGWYTNPNMFSLRNPEFPKAGDPDICTTLTGDFVPPECFMSQEQAQQRGRTFFDYTSYKYDGTVLPPPDPTDRSLFDDSIGDQAAFNQLFDGDIVFGGALSALSRLAFGSGGYVCPLLPVAPPSFYIDHDKDDNDTGDNGWNCDPADLDATPCVLRESHRPYPAATPIGESALRIAPTNQSPAAQAAECVVKAIGSNPYHLVEEER